MRIFLFSAFHPTLFRFDFFAHSIVRTGTPLDARMFTLETSQGLALLLDSTPLACLLLVVHILCVDILQRRGEFLTRAFVRVYRILLFAGNLVNPSSLVHELEEFQIPESLRATLKNALCLPASRWILVYFVSFEIYDFLAFVRVKNTSSTLFSLLKSSLCICVCLYMLNPDSDTHAYFLYLVWDLLFSPSLRQNHTRSQSTPLRILANLWTLSRISVLCYLSETLFANRILLRLNSVYRL